MMFRRSLSFVTALAFVAFTPMQAVAAGSQAPSASDQRHVVSERSLHQAVMAAHDRADQARRTVESFLDLPEVRSQIRQVGLSPESVKSQVAMLSDADLQLLRQQLMPADLQAETAGLSKGAIIGIVVLSIGGLVLLSTLIEVNELSGS